MQINKLVALVTGGASGLGEATARYLATKGAFVTILDFNYERAVSVANEIGGLAVACDVTDENNVRNALSTSEEYWTQPARVVVNCAGIAPGARIVGREEKLSVELFKKTINLNLFGTYHVMSYAAQSLLRNPPLEDGNRGVIINTSSVAYEDGQIGQTAYAASKGAISSLTLPAAREFSRHAIRVMSIAPGLFKTPLMENLPEDTVAAIAQSIPFPNRLGLAEEFAHLVCAILENDYLNGTVIRLDGATRLPPR